MIQFKSFQYRTSITGIKSKENQENGENTEQNVNFNADPPAPVRKGIDAVKNATFKIKDKKLICLLNHTLYKIFKIILNRLLKNMKLQQIIF